MSSAQYGAELYDAGALPAIVRDGLVPPELAGTISGLMAGNIWQYGWRDNGRGGGQGYLSCDFAGTSIHSNQSCISELSQKPNNRPIFELWQIVAQVLSPDAHPVRAYAAAHSFGLSGGIHKDNRHDPNQLSIVYYAHPQWQPDWGGETMFYNPASLEIVQTVYARPGRLVLFRGDYPHCARPPSRECPALRSVIVFKARRP